MPPGEAYLTRTFDVWRAEFRAILEDHRRDIQDRLEKIEREIEKKSDKENVDLLVRSLREDLRRHAEDIKAVSVKVQSSSSIEVESTGATLAMNSNGDERTFVYMSSLAFARALKYVRKTSAL